MKIYGSFWLVLTTTMSAIGATAFEGKVNVAMTRGGETQTLLYTVGKHELRIERIETDWPHAKNIVNLDTGAVTLVFPHNRSFVRLKAGVQETAPVFPGAPPMPLPPGGLPPGIGPRTTPGAPTLPSVPGGASVPGAPSVPPLPATPQLPPGIGPQSQTGVAATPGTPQPGLGPAGIPSNFPAMPMMPPMSGEQVELKATDDKKEILGFPCTRYELKQRGEIMEIWATDKLLPFQLWLANQPPRFGPRMIEEKWGEMLKAKKLFPLSATLKFENGPERLRFEVKSIKPEKIADPDGTLFQPPPDYHEIQPLPF